MIWIRHSLRARTVLWLSSHDPGPLDSSLAQVVKRPPVEQVVSPYRRNYERQDHAIPGEAPGTPIYSDALDHGRVQLGSGDPVNKEVVPNDQADDRVSESNLPKGQKVQVACRLLPKGPLAPSPPERHTHCSELDARALSGYYSPIRMRGAHSIPEN